MPSVSRGDLAPRNEAIRAVGIEKVFQRDDSRVVALQDVDLAVPAGAFVSVIGPSGCGKTSFLRIVGDLEDPTSAIVFCSRKDETRTVAGVLRRAGYHALPINADLASLRPDNWQQYCEYHSSSMFVSRA